MLHKRHCQRPARAARRAKHQQTASTNTSTGIGSGVRPSSPSPLHFSPRLHLLRVLLALHADSAGAVRVALFLVQRLAHGVIVGRLRAVDVLFKHGLGVDRLELGRERGRRVAAAVGAAAGVCQVDGKVLDLIALAAPIRVEMENISDLRDLIPKGNSKRTGFLFLPVALATTVLLGLVAVGVHMARLGKIARQMLLGSGGAVGQADLVTIIVFVGASHCEEGEWCRQHCAGAYEES